MQGQFVANIVSLSMLIRLISEPPKDYSCRAISRRGKKNNLLRVFLKAIVFVQILVLFSRSVKRQSNS